jgi:hypothetical protein
MLHIVSRFSTPKMETAMSSEKFVSYHVITWDHNPETETDRSFDDDGDDADDANIITFNVLRSKDAQFC